MKRAPTYLHVDGMPLTVQNRLQAFVVFALLSLSLASAQTACSGGYANCSGGASQTVWASTADVWGVATRSADFSGLLGAPTYTGKALIHSCAERYVTGMARRVTVCCCPRSAPRNWRCLLAWFYSPQPRLLAFASPLLLVPGRCNSPSSVLPSSLWSLRQDTGLTRSAWLILNFTSALVATEVGASKHA